LLSCVLLLLFLLGFDVLFAPAVVSILYRLVVILIWWGESLFGETHYEMVRSVRGGGGGSAYLLHTNSIFKELGLTIKATKTLSKHGGYQQTK
jgi:hypothetical protein